jgi:hypothetical protein
MADVHFDFGIWNQKAGWIGKCPKHGPQQSGLSISLPPLIRNYCGECLIELLDQFCHPLEYVNENDGSL